MIDSKQRTLLLWHKRLNRWMPPGGHIDPNETPAETARRECKEETGLDVEIIGDEQPNLFADCPQEGRMLKRPFMMLLEDIPANEDRGEPAHQHMDFLFIAKPIDEFQSLTLAEHEGAELRWFTAADVALLDDTREIFGNVKNYLLMCLIKKY